MRKKCTLEFINEANKKHNYKYDYSKADYKGCKDKLLIICKTCKIEFYQTPDGHLRGSSGGCKNCINTSLSINRRKTVSQFIEDAIKVHENKYNYSLVNESNYINKETKVPIKCINCDLLFYQTPGNHINQKNGCPFCSHSIISKLEIEWLNSLNIDISYRQKTIKINTKNYKVDAYDLITNTVYEFYGDYWHGNPDIFDQNKTNSRSNKTFGELYKNTMSRHNKILEAGYSIVYIWENDFKKMKKNKWQKVSLK